jgi:Flp pilus assembly pilin Flp
MIPASALLRDESGATIVEMAIAAPLLATFLIGMVDLSSAYSAKLQVEQAAQRTIEMVQRNGYDSTKESALKSEAEAAAGTGSTAVVEASLECDGVKASSYDDPCTNKPVVREVAVIITKPYKPFMKLRWGGNADGTYTVRAKAGIRVQ